MTRDGAPGLIGALEATWPRALRIRCWFHKMQNLRQKVPPDQWPLLRALIIDMRDAPDLETANGRLDELLRNYQSQFAELCRCLRDDCEASLNHLQVPIAIVTMFVRSTWWSEVLRNNVGAPK